MDLMTANGQFKTEFRRHDAAAAVRGIAGDADLHMGRVTLEPARRQKS
jgi:hypothetical protein